jgi:hypothetical protein
VNEGRIHHRHPPIEWKSGHDNAGDVIGARAIGSLSGVARKQAGVGLRITPLDSGMGRLYIARNVFSQLVK